MSTDKKNTNVNAAVSEADQIWNEISHLPINIYALPNRKVNQHVTKLNVPGIPKLFVKLASQAVLPALEESLGKKFKVEPAEGFVTITRNVDFLPLVQKALRDLEQ